MEKSELNELIDRYLELKKKSSKIDRVVTYKLYNELIKPKKKRSHKDCTCMDRDTDAKVAMWLEKHHKVEEPLPIESNVEIDMSSFLAKKPAPKKKTTRKRRTTKKTNEGTKTNGVSTDS